MNRRSELHARRRREASCLHDPFSREPKEEVKQLKTPVGREKFSSESHAMFERKVSDIKFICHSDFGSQAQIYLSPKDDATFYGCLFMYLGRSSCYYSALHNVAKAANPAAAAELVL